MPARAEAHEVPIGASRPDAGNRAGGAEARRPDVPAAGGQPADEQATRLAISHELRTPLHAILGNVELLLDGSAGPLSSEARSCLADVQSAGRQLLAQMAEVQLLVQAMATRGPGAEDRVDLIEALRAALCRRGAAREVEIAPGGASLAVHGDAFWLEALIDAIAKTCGSAAHSGEGGARLVLAPADGGAGEGATMRVTWWGAQATAVPPVRLALIEAIVHLHGGRASLALGHDLTLIWPAHRVVSSGAVGLSQAAESRPLTPCEQRG